MYESLEGVQETPTKGRLRRALLAAALVATVTTSGVAAGSSTPASAAPCTVTAQNWAPVVVRTAGNTSSGTDSGIRLLAGDTVPSECVYRIGGTYTACSSSGTSTNRWVKLTGAWTGYWVAWRCVSGPN